MQRWSTAKRANLAVRREPLMQKVWEKTAEKVRRLLKFQRKVQNQLGA